MEYLNPDAQKVQKEILDLSHQHVNDKGISFAEYHDKGNPHIHGYLPNNGIPPFQPPQQESPENGLSRAELLTLFRCFPAQDQPYMYLTINPGGGKPTEQALLAATDGDVDQIAGVTRNFLIGDYLSGKENFGKLVKELGKVATKRELASVTGDEGLKKYFQTDRAEDWMAQAEAMVNPEDPKTSELVLEWMEENPQEGVQPDTGFFNDFYYSVAYKLASERSGDLRPADKRLVEEYVMKEIKSVDPEVIICSGALPWERVQEHMEDVEPIGESEFADLISYSRSGVFRANVAGKRRHVLAIKHPSRMHSNQITDRDGDLIDNVKEADIF